MNQQKSQGDLRFIPWKQLLTAQCDNLKQGVQKKEKSFLCLLSEAFGQWDMLESGPSASPFSAQRLLMTRSIAWALTGWCHLSSSKQLVRKFLHFYTRGGDPESGLRAPSLAEAEAADIKLCRELYGSLANMARNSLRIWLQPRPRPPAAKGNGKGKQPRKKRDGDRKLKGTRHAFQVGKCKYGDDCKLEHACENCGQSGHGRGVPQVFRVGAAPRPRLGRCCG